MERASDYRTQDEPVQGEIQPERMRCFNCKQMVPKNTICSICGYPLLIGIPEHPEPEDAIDGSHMAAATPQGSEDTNGLLLEASSDQDTEASDHREQGMLNHSASEEEAGKEAETSSEPVKSTSFFDELRKYMGGKKTPKPEDAEDQVENSSHWFDEVKQGQVIGEASATVSNEPKTESDEAAVEGVDEIHENPQADAEIPATEIDEAPNVVESPPIRVSEGSTISADGIDPKLREVQEGLLQSISLKLWLVNLLQRGGIDEEQFIKMFDEYEAQISGHLKSREKLLDQEPEIESLEKSLSEAKVYLEELKMKREIGKISEEEYRAKAPAFKWEINHYRERIADGERDIEYLEDLTRVMPMEDIIDTTAKLEECKRDMDSQGLSGDISAETTKRVKESLARTLEFMEKAKVNSSRIPSAHPQTFL
jgi:hypothetical protein